MEEGEEMFKVCPLLATQPGKLDHVRTLDTGLESQYAKWEIGCVEDRCAWWSGHECAVIWLINTMDMIRLALEEGLIKK